MSGMVEKQVSNRSLVLIFKTYLMQCKSGLQLNKSKFKKYGLRPQLLLEYLYMKYPEYWNSCVYYNTNRGSLEHSCGCTVFAN